MARKQTGPAVAFAGAPRVNLMPRAELDRRERATAIRRWGWGVVGALTVVVLVAAGGYGMSWAAKQRLASAQSQTATLVGQLGGLSDVSMALRTQKELETFRAQALAADLDWYGTLDSLSTVTPAGAVLVGFDLTSGGVPAAGAAAKTQQGLVGTLILGSLDPIDMVTMIRAFRKVPGVASVDGVQLVSSDTIGISGVYAYSLTVVFDQTVYTGTYAEGKSK